MKIINAIVDRELLELLYGVPSIWSLDLQDINKYGPHIKKLYKFFYPIHKAIAEEELKDFKWLDEKRLVQQTIFGNKVKLTANFSDKLFKTIKPKTIEIEWITTGIKEYYTP